MILGVLFERVLRARLKRLEHAYRVCGLCCRDACDDCLILRQRLLDDAWGFHQYIDQRLIKDTGYLEEAPIFVAGASPGPI